MNFIGQHRQKFYFILGLLVISHLSNIFIFKNFYTSDFTYHKFWLLFLPAAFGMLLFIVLGFEHAMRRRKKGIFKYIEVSFLSILSITLLFIFVMGSWNFGGLRDLFQ